MLKKKGFETLDDIVEKAVMTPEAIMRMPTYHIILLAANEVGRINLYRLISRHMLNILPEDRDSHAQNYEIQRGTDYWIGV